MQVCYTRRRPILLLVMPSLFSLTVLSSCFLVCAWSLSSSSSSVSGSSSSSSSKTTSTKFSTIYQQFDVWPAVPIVSIEDDGEKGLGLYAKKEINEGETVFAVPLISCLCDDNPPPKWLGSERASAEDDWPIRLAAQFIEMNKYHGGDTSAYGIWLDLLPDSNTLKNILPIHWDDGLLRATGSIDLELEVDNAYFGRADSIDRLAEANELLSEKDCRYALDIIQTRSCRLPTGGPLGGGGARRVLAPVFDLLNHDNDANAAFVRGGTTSPTETTALVVETTRKIHKGEEICIDYGECARPAYKSLFSYGFLNKQERSGTVVLPSPPGQPPKRFTVQPDTVPYELVETVSQKFLQQEQVALTPKVCYFLIELAQHQAAQLEDYDESAIYDDTSGRLALDLRKSELQALREFSAQLEEYVGSV